MEKRYFPLGSNETGAIIKVIRTAFGVVCIMVALFWLFYNKGSLKTDKTLWITILFLSGFGIYQIWSGVGLATRFIEISPDKIRVKKNSILSPVEIKNTEIGKIEVYPMNLIIYMKTGKKTLIRFGAIYQDTNELIKDEIISFAGHNSIELEMVKEII